MCFVAAVPQSAILVTAVLSVEGDRMFRCCCARRVHKKVEVNGRKFGWMLINNIGDAIAVTESKCCYFFSISIYRYQIRDL